MRKGLFVVNGGGRGKQRKQGSCRFCLVLFIILFTGRTYLLKCVDQSRVGWINLPGVVLFSGVRFYLLLLTTLARYYCWWWEGIDELEMISWKFLGFDIE